MNTRHKILTAVLVFCTVVGAYAAKGTPLVATFASLLSTPSVSGDASAVYANGSNGVQVYFGVSGKDVDLVTYNTGRTLHFVFDTSSPAFQASGLPISGVGNWEVDFYGVNFFGAYTSVGIGNTAQVHGVLQWHVPNSPSTYQLDYQSLAAMRISQNTWLVTSNPADIPGFPGFTASDQALLSSFRKRINNDYGAVNMPIHFTVVLQ